MDRVKDKDAAIGEKLMHVPVTVSTFGALSALLVVSLATVSDASSGQGSIFSEAQAYERFMGRWSRSLAPLFVRFAGVRDGDGQSHFKIAVARDRLVFNMGELRGNLGWQPYRNDWRGYVSAGWRLA